MVASNERQTTSLVRECLGISEFVESSGWTVEKRGGGHGKGGRKRALLKGFQFSTKVISLFEDRGKTFPEATVEGIGSRQGRFVKDWAPRCQFLVELGAGYLASPLSIGACSSLNVIQQPPLEIFQLVQQIGPFLFVLSLLALLDGEFQLLRHST
jgi:hypothetical protein